MIFILSLENTDLVEPVNNQKIDKLRPFLAFSKIAGIMPCKGGRKKSHLPFGKSATCPWGAGKAKIPPVLFGNFPFLVV